MKRIFALLLAMVLAAPAGTMALGLGRLEHFSGLNEPFRGRIELLGATEDDLETVKIGLAPQERFARAGIEWRHALTSLRFTIVDSEQGPDHVEVSSVEPIPEPFLNFLLEISWPRGRLLREYTVLLDPPVYDTRRAAIARTTGVAETEPSTRAPAAEPTMDTEAPGAFATPGAAAGRATESGDTLWSIASAAAPGDGSVSVQQMMLAILRTNPEAFAEQNVNMLRRGHVLQIPDAGEAAAISQSEALEEVGRQHALWEEYRQAAGRAPTSPLPVGATADLGTEPRAAEAVARPETELVAESRLKLLAATDEAGGAAEIATAADFASRDLEELRRQLALVSEQHAAQSQENVELKDQLKEAEELIESLQRLITLREEELAALQQRLAAVQGQAAAEPPPAPEPVPEPEPAAEEEEPAAETPEPSPPEIAEQEVELEVAAPEEEEAPAAGPETEEEPVVEVAPPPPPSGLKATLDDVVSAVLPDSLIRSIPGGGATAIGAVLLLLALFIGAVIFARRALRGDEGEELPAGPALAGEDTTVVGDEEEPITEVRGDEQATAAPEEDEGPALAEEPDDKTQIALPEVRPPAREPQKREPAKAPAEPEVDPLAEVNVYLAYEQFDRAEQVVKDAIAKAPRNNNFKLRLLEVYYSSNNKKAYEEAARSLHGAVGGSGPEWDSAVAMWQEMSPDRALFEAGAEEELEAAAPAPARTEFVDIFAAEAAAPGEDTVAIKPGAPGREEPAGEAAELGALDLTLDSAAESEEEAGILDVTSGAEQRSDDDLLDLTAAAEEVQTSISEPDDDVLDLTAAAGQSAEAGLEFEEPAEEETPAGAAVLDITSGGEEALELSIGDAGAAPGEGMLDITAGESEPALEEDSILDLTATGAGARGGDLLDVTRTGDVSSIDHTDLLNVTSPGTLAAREAEEALEIAADELPEPDVLDVTGAVGAGAAEEQGIEFDLSGVRAVPELGSEDATIDVGAHVAAAGAAKPAGGDDNVLEFDVSGLSLDLGDAGAAEAPEVDLELVAEEPAGAGGELEIDLGDSGESTAGDTALELEPPADSGAELSLEDFESAGAAESLDDLAKSLNESVAGLSISVDDDSDLGLELEGADDRKPGAGHLETVEMDQELSFEEEDEAEKTIMMPRAPNVEEQSEEDEVDTKLNLAKAYIELGDGEGARTILDEVLSEGTVKQKQAAEKLIAELR
jgi:pilus assembly protein FimV